jgi:hypothetical protein
MKQPVAANRQLTANPKYIMKQNHWMKLAAARKIADELQRKYCGHSLLKDEDSNILTWTEDEMFEYFCSHQDWDEEMWLNVHWDDFECVSWVQVGVHEDLVPR